MRRHFSRIVGTLFLFRVFTVLIFCRETARDIVWHRHVNQLPRTLLLSLLGMLFLATGCDSEAPDLASESQLSPKPKLDLKLVFETELAEPAEPQSVNPEFVDVASEWGLDFHYYSDDQSGNLNFPEVFGGGVACLDYDLDGWPDVFLPNGCTLPDGAVKQENLDQLFRNQSGRAANVSQLARITGSQFSHGCSFGDINGDGFEDLVVANLGTCEVWSNQGDGTFLPLEIPELKKRSSWWMVPVLTDLDNDQTPDLLVVPYVAWKEGTPLSKQLNGPGYPGPNEFDALPMLALRNLGDGSWQDASSEWGLARDAKGMAVVAADFDGDLQTEIYVANDSIANTLFTRSQHLSFDPKLTNASRSLGSRSQRRTVDQSESVAWTEIGEVSGTAAGGSGVTEASMSATVADFDQNQLPDLLVTNYFRRPNSLYTNRGNLNFRNIAYASRMDAIGKAFLTFGAVAIDYDLDGAWDVVTANGHVLGPYAAVHTQTSQVLRNIDGAFVDVSSVAGSFFQRKGLGRSVATLDFDCDGDSDLLLTFSDSPTSLLENRTQRNNNWVSIEIADHQHRPLAGARIELLVNQHVSKVIPVVTGGSYLSDSQKQWTVGLPSTIGTSITEHSPSIVSLKVYWPAGDVDQWDDIVANRRYRCLPGRLQTLRVNGTSIEQVRANDSSTLRSSDAQENLE